MQTRTLIGIGLAALSGIGFGAGGIAAQYLFTYCRFTPLDLVSIRLFGAGLILLLAYGSPPAGISSAMFSETSGISARSSFLASGFSFCSSRFLCRSRNPTPARRASWWVLSRS